jgi:hypothetical protein
MAPGGWRLAATTCETPAWELAATTDQTFAQVHVVSGWIVSGRMRSEILQIAFEQ